MIQTVRQILIPLLLLAGATAAQAQTTCRVANALEASVYSTPTFMPGVISPKDGTCFVNNFKVSTSDGVELVANVFLPAQTNNQSKYPGVVFISSWASAEFFEYLGIQHKLAQQGYVAMAYTTRGFYNSGGVVKVASPQDVRDVSSVVDHMLLHTPTDAARIGVTGISYGAGLSLLALAQDARLKTAVAMSGWGTLADQMYPQDVPNQTWLAFLLGSGYLTARMDPEVAQLAQRVLNTEATPADIAYVKAWAATRSPSMSSVINAINARQAPVMLSKNWRDEMFTPNSSMKMFERLTGPKKLLLQPGIHATAEISGAIFGIVNPVYDEANRWFDHWLKDIPNGINTEPKIKLKTPTSTAYETLSTWPAPELKTTTLFMDPRGKIRWDFACICWKGDVGSLRTASNEPRGTDVINNWFDTTATSGVIPVLTPLADSVGIPVTNWTTSILRDQGIRYKGSPTTSVTRIRGIPKVNLRVKPSQSRGMLVAYLYSVDRFGMGTLVTHGARALHWATPMQSVDFSFELNATAFDVPAGNRLELVFDTSDSLYASPVRIGESFNMTIETGAASASLVLPTR